MKLNRGRSCHHVRMYDCGGTKDQNVGFLYVRNDVSLRLTFSRLAFNEPSETLNIALGNVPTKFFETYATTDEVDELAKALRNIARQMRRARREWKKKGISSLATLPILGDKP